VAQAGLSGSPKRGRILILRPPSADGVAAGAAALCEDDCVYIASNPRPKPPLTNLAQLHKRKLPNSNTQKQCKMTRTIHKHAVASMQSIPTLGRPQSAYRVVPLHPGQLGPIRRQPGGRVKVVAARQPRDVTAGQVWRGRAKGGGVGGMRCEGGLRRGRACVEESWGAPLRGWVLSFEDGGC
jgi:hypothetical protein